VPQPPLPEEVHPVAHPAVGLRRAANGVVDREAEPALPRVLVLS
jgi:hypothetical protein